MSADLVRRAVAVNQAQFRIGNQVFEAAGGTFIRNRNAPDIRDANHVESITASTVEEIERLFARADEEFAHAPHRAYHVDAWTPPPFIARLALEGFTRDDALIMLLEGELQGAQPKPMDIRLIDSDALWDAFYELYRHDWREHLARTRQNESDEVGRRMADTRRAKCPPARYFLAFEDGAARGYFSSLPGIAHMAQVEDLFVQAEYRDRGIATGLIHHCVGDARSRRAGPVVIVSDPTDTPKHMYNAMGFRPVAIKSSYYKKLDLSAAATPASPRR